MITVIKNECEPERVKYSAKLRPNCKKPMIHEGISLLIHFCLPYQIKDFKAICSLMLWYLSY